MEESISFKVVENEVLIGRLTRFSDATYVFEYNDDYVKKGGHELCVTMPMDRGPIKTFEIHPFFQNYVSEGWLKKVQEQNLETNISPRTKTSDLIVRFGLCFGALQVLPEQELEHAGHHHYRLVVEENHWSIAQKINSAEPAMIPGAQPKVLVVETAEQGVFRLAAEFQTSTHIAKLTHEKASMRGILENELLATKLVKVLLPEDEVCDVRLGVVEGVKDKALLIKRFDRDEKGQRTPFYEFSQLLSKSLDQKYDGCYSEMADFIYERSGPEGKNGIRCDIRDARRLFRRVLVDVLIGNTDAHFKNFAMKKEGGKFRLTPNYDLVSSAMFGDGKKDKFLSVALEVGGKRILNISQLEAKRIIVMAYQFQITPQELIEDVKDLKSRMPEAFKLVHDFADVSKENAKHFESFLRKRWNGTFEHVEAVLTKNRPQNTFKHKKSRKKAEEALLRAVKRPASKTIEKGLSL